MTLSAKYLATEGELQAMSPEARRAVKHNYLNAALQFRAAGDQMHGNARELEDAARKIQGMPPAKKSTDNQEKEA